MNFLTVAESINKIFYNYDYNILSFLHKLAESLGNFLTPLFNFLSLLFHCLLCPLPNRVCRHSNSRRPWP